MLFWTAVFSAGGPTINRLKKKNIIVELNLVDNEFPSGSNYKTLEGLATRVRIVKAGLPALNTAIIDIDGMEQEAIARITTTSHLNLTLKRNIVMIKAGNVGETPSVVFVGEIILAYAMYPSPNRAVHIEAISGIFDNIDPKEQLTSKVPVSGKSVLKRLCESIGYIFRDNDAPDKELDNIVLNGSTIEKIVAISRHMGVESLLDDGQLIVSPPNKGLDEPVTINKFTGMEGYPTIQPHGLRVGTVWNPNLKQGGLIRITSIVPRATGVWKIIRLDQALEAYGYGNSWTTYMDCIYADYNQ